MENRAETSLGRKDGGGFFITIGSLLEATEYSWIDRINFFRGIFTSVRLMWPQLLNVNLMKQASELKVPIYFLEGKHDYEAPSIHRVFYQVGSTLRADIKYAFGMDFWDKCLCPNGAAVRHSSAVVTTNLKTLRPRTTSPRSLAPVRQAA
jgi:hypothetical protein